MCVRNLCLLKEKYKTLVRITVYSMWTFSLSLISLKFTVYVLITRWNRMRVFPPLPVTAAWQSLQVKVFFSFFGENCIHKMEDVPFYVERERLQTLRCSGSAFTSSRSHHVNRCRSVLQVGGRVVRSSVPGGRDLLPGGWSASVWSSVWRLRAAAPHRLVQFGINSVGVVWRQKLQCSWWFLLS